MANPIPEYNPFAPISAAPPAYQPFTFRQVLENYDEDRKRNPLFSKMTLPEYAATINQQTGTDIASAGLEDSWLKRRSVNIDQLLDYGGAPRAAEHVGQLVGAPFGASEMVGDTFKGLPRAVTNLLPLLVAPEAGIGYAAGVGGSAALAGAQTYADTGSGKAGLLTGATQLLMPGLAGKAGQAGLSAAGATLKNEAGQLIGETFKQKLAGYGAAQATGLGLAEVGHQGTSLLTTGDFDFSRKHFLETVVGQLPFLAFDAGTGALNPLSKEAIQGLKAERNTKLVNNALNINQPTFEGEYSVGAPSAFTPTTNFNLRPVKGVVPNADNPLPFDLGAMFRPNQEVKSATSVDIGPELQLNADERKVVEHNGSFYYLNSETRPGQPNSVAYLQRIDTGAPFSALVSDLNPTDMSASLFAITQLSEPTKFEPEPTKTLFGAPVQESSPTLVTPKVEPSTPNVSPESVPEIQPKAVPTPAVVEPIMADILSEKDSVKALKKINKAYKEIFEPQFGVQDVQLGRLSDAELKNSIVRHMAEGANLDDAVQLTLEGIYNSLNDAVNSRVNITQQNARGRTQSAKLEAAMPGLRELDEIWQHMTKEQREPYGKLGPLDKVIRWRNDIIHGDEHSATRYAKYDQVDEALLTAAGNLKWKDGRWYDQEGKTYSDDGAKKYLRNAASFAYRAATKSEQGGREVVEGEEVTPVNEARQRAEQMNGALEPNSSYRYHAEEEFDAEGRPTGNAKVVKHYQLKSSMTGGERDVTNTTTAPQLHYDEAQQNVTYDMVEKGVEDAMQVKHESDQTAADVTAQHSADIIRLLIDRLHPFDRTLSEMGMKNAGELVARAKFMIEAFTDKRFSLPGEEVNWGDLLKRQNVLPEQWQFKGTDKISPEKQAASWYNETGTKFLWGKDGWFARQPEMQAWLSGKPASQILYEMQQAQQKRSQATKLSVSDIPAASVQNIPEPGQRGLKYKDTVVGSAAGTERMGKPESKVPVRSTTPESMQMTTMDFARRYFMRSGETPEGAQLYADSVERILRMSQVFPAAQTANIIGIGKGRGELSVTDPTLLGATWHLDSANLDPKWRAVVGLKPMEYSIASQASAYGMVLSHEAWHVVEGAARRGLLKPGEQQAYEQIQTMAQTLDESQRYDALNEAAKVMGDFSGDKLAQQNLEGLIKYSAQAPEEFSATMAAFFSKAVADGYTPKRLGSIIDHFIYGDGVVAKFAQMIMRAGSKLTSAIRGIFAAQKVGAVEPRALSGQVKVHIDNINQAFTKLARQPEEVQAAGRKIVELDALKPESIEQALNNGFQTRLKELLTGDKEIDGATEVAYAKILKADDKRNINWYERNLVDFMQLAQIHQDLRPIAVEALAHEALAKNGAEDALSCLFQRDYKTGKVEVTEVQKSVQAVLNSNRLNDVLSEQTRLENLNGKRMSPDETKKFYTSKGISSAQQNQLTDARQALANIGQKLGEQIVRGQKAELVHAAARVLMSGHDVPYKQALDAAERLTAVQLHVAGVEPLPVGVDPIALSASIPGDFSVDPTKVAGAGQLLTQLAPMFGKLKQIIADHPEFVTEQRMGRYGADYTVQGETKRGYISAENPRELEAKITALSKDPKNTNFQRYDNTDKSFIGLNANIVNSLHEIGQAAFERTLLGQPADVADQARAAFQNFNTAVEGELAARGVERWTQNRRFAAGRETIDMLRNTMKFASAVPRSLAKTWLKSRTSVVMQDARLVENPVAAQVGAKHIENILSTDAPWVHKAREWTFGYYLGANLSSAVIEFAQPMLAVPAQMIKSGAGVRESFGTLKDAYLAVAKAYTSGKYENKFVDDMIFKLEEGKLLDKSTLGYFFDGENVGGLNLAKATDGDTAWETAVSASQKGISHLMSMSKSLYSKATNITSRVSAVAGALQAEKLIKAGKMKPEDALDFVKEFVVLTAPGTGGKSARPVGYYGGGPNWISRSLAGTIGSLQGYTMTMTSMAYRMVKDAISSGTLKGSAGKAALVLLGTQLIAAGVTGLPGVGTAINVANAGLPNLNIKKNLKTGLASMFGEDKGQGGFWSDLMLRGAPTVMSGVDTSTRLGLSTMLGVSSYDGFKLEHLFGAPGSILSNLGTAVQQAATGEVTDALQTAAPTSIKNLVKLVRDGGDVRDAQGNLMYEPNAAEKFAMAVGFTPAKAAEMREFNNLAKQADQGAADEQNRFYNDAAEQLVNKNYAQVRQMLLERERANPGTFSAAEGLKQVVQKAQDRTMPEDPRRGGSKLNMNDRSQLLGTYGMQGPSPSETQRLMQRTQIEQMFGLHGGTQRSEIMKAQWVDRLMMENPTLTRAQARAQVDELTRRRATQVLQ